MPTLESKKNESRYIRHLPAIYQKNEFLGRFLMAFEDILSGGKDNMPDAKGIAEVLDVLHDYFDPTTAPEEFLKWLAGWTALKLHEGEWLYENLGDEGKVAGVRQRLPLRNGKEDGARRLIRDLVPLYRERGTQRGLEKLLKVYLTNITEENFTDEPKRYFIGNLEDRVFVNELKRRFIVGDPKGIDGLDFEGIVKAVCFITKGVTEEDVDAKVRETAESKGKPVPYVYDAISVHIFESQGFQREVLARDPDRDIAKLKGIGEEAIEKLSGLMAPVGSVGEMKKLLKKTAYEELRKGAYRDEAGFMVGVSTVVNEGFYSYFRVNIFLPLPEKEYLEVKWGRRLAATTKESALEKKMKAAREEGRVGVEPLFYERLLPRKKAIEGIIDFEKPAHTYYTLKLVVFPNPIEVGKAKESGVPPGEHVHKGRATVGEDTLLGTLII